MNCDKCSKGFGFLDTKYYFNDNGKEICVCRDCSNYLKEQKKIEEERERAEKEESANKKALEKNDRYEYKILNLKGSSADWNSGLNAIGNRLNPKDESLLNDLGRVGWKLISAVPMNSLAPRLGQGSESATEWVSCVFRRKI